MKRILPFITALALLLGLAPGRIERAQAVSTSIVISQVYGGGGNTGAVYLNDYVEVFNRGSQPAALDGWSVQYASATGSGNFSANPVTSLSGTLQPGQYYLVRLASGGGTGAPLPAADAVGTVNLSGSSGKVIVASTASGLACNGGSTPCSPDQLALIVDLVGYGEANFYEGSAAAPVLSAATAGLRLGGGCVESDDNGSDFAVGTPSPRNTASPPSVCVPEPAACLESFTPAYTIQDSGSASPLAGTVVTTQGIVVSDNEGPSPALRGFYLQDATGDGEIATSDAIFVYHANLDTVNLGDEVRVTGTVSEYYGQTQVSATTVTFCEPGKSVAPVNILLPFADFQVPERYEGMLVRLPQTLSVTENYQLGRYGQVTLSSGGRLNEPTNVVAPGDAALALQAQNDLNRIILDDGLTGQNLDPILFGRAGLPLTAANTLRSGDKVAGVVGVLGYGFDAYRVYPLNAMGGSLPFFQPANPRSSAPEEVGGTIKAAGLNLFNYFNTFTGCTAGVGGTLVDCRGANSAEEFERQWPKTVAGILATNADIIGLVELENDGYGPDSAIQDLVNRLNAAAGAGTFAFIDADAGTGQINALGTDAIKVGLVYRPAQVSPVGTTAVLNTIAFVNGGDAGPRNRPALAQAFQQVSTGARLVVSVNHLKSKSTPCDLPDQNDGQGNCAAVREAAAAELVAWLATDPTGTGDPDALILGDLNAYAKEDALTVLAAGGYVDLAFVYSDPGAYSYGFNGQWGALDHALANASLAAQVTGMTEFHINADEPPALDYNTEFKTTNQLDILYEPDLYRMSDHDPLVVGLALTNLPPAADAGGPYLVLPGRTARLTASGADPDGSPVTFAWDLDGDSLFETPGQVVEFIPNGMPGTVYTVRVRVTDATGQAGEAQATVTVGWATWLPSISR